MIYKFYYFSVILIFCISNLINAQDENSKTNQWIQIDKELLYNIVIATDMNQQITKGLLYGMKGDSIYLSMKNEMIKINVRDLITISIEDRRTSNRGFVFGTIGGMYLGTLLFITSKDQPARYLDYADDEAGVFALYELLFACVGGGLGYLIDRSSGDKQEVFYFNQDEESIDKEIKELENFLTNSSTSRKMKINFHLSQVNTRLSEIQDNTDDNYYWNGYYNSNYYQLHNFNMLRKLSLTYEVFEKLEIGIALDWFGEPSFSYIKTDYRYDTLYTYTTNTINQSYDGLGYYLVINFKPLRNIIPEYFDILVGAGAGIGKVDYNFKNETVTQIPESEPIVVTDESMIDEVLFSSIIFGELKYFIFPELSISIQADYVYLPEKIPAIPEFEIGERNLGNFSFGLGVGFNF